MSTYINYGVITDYVPITACIPLLVSVYRSPVKKITVIILAELMNISRLRSSDDRKNVVISNSELRNGNGNRYERDTRD